MVDASQSSGHAELIHILCMGAAPFAYEFRTSIHRMELCLEVHGMLASSFAGCGVQLGKEKHH